MPTSVLERSFADNPGIDSGNDWLPDYEWDNTTIDPERAVRDNMAEQLVVDHEQRRGTEIQLDNGEVVRPCFPLDIVNLEDQELLQQAIQQRRSSLENALKYVHETEGPIDQTKLIELLGVSARPVGASNEKTDDKGNIIAERRCGGLVDIYSGPHEISLYAELANAVDEKSSKDAPTAAQLGITAEQCAQRAVDYAVTLIPADVPLAHAVGPENAYNIIANGSLTTRHNLDTSSHMGSRVSRNGNHTNLVHFAEPGKVNTAYGGTIMLVPAEVIMRHSNIAMTEGMYTTHANEPQVQEPMGRIEFDVDTAPLAIKQRLATLHDRFAQGLMAEGTQGERNNLSFAASDDPDTAAKYSYPIDKMALITDQETGAFDQTWKFWETIPGAQEWVGAHVVQSKTPIQGIGGNGMRGRVPLGIAGIEMPASLRNDTERVAAYGSVAQRTVNFTEADLGGKVVKLHKPAEVDLYRAWVEQEAIRAAAEADSHQSRSSRPTSSGSRSTRRV